MPHSCVDCLEILRPSTSWNPKSLTRHVQGELYLVLVCMVGITEGKSPLGRLRREWNNTVKMDRGEMEWEGVDWTIVAEYKDIRKVVVHTAI